MENNLRKGSEIMKKIITVISALILVACMATLFYGCGAKDEPTTTDTTADITMNDGMVTDESLEDDNGIIGDIVTDMSEDVSEIVTDMADGDTTTDTTR